MSTAFSEPTNSSTAANPEAEGSLDYRQLADAVLADLVRQVRSTASIHVLDDDQETFGAALLAGVVLGMAMSTITFSRNVASTDMRSRAQARADLQIARARAWPSYATLGDLALTVYNPADDGLKTETSVKVDTTSGHNYTVVQVTITGTPSTNLPIPVKRSITIAAP